MKFAPWDHRPKKTQKTDHCGVQDLGCFEKKGIRGEHRMGQKREGVTEGLDKAGFRARNSCEVEDRKSVLLTLRTKKLDIHAKIVPGEKNYRGGTRRGGFFREEHRGGNMGVQKEKDGKEKIGHQFQGRKIWHSTP